MPDIEDYVEKIGCFSDRGRILVIDYLFRNGRSSVEDIVEGLDMKYSKVYSYLKDFRKAGLVSVENEGGRGGKKLYSPLDPDIKISREFVTDLLSEMDLRGVIFDVDDTLVRRKDIPEKLREVGKSAVSEAKRRLLSKGMSISEPPEDLFSEEWIASKYGNSVEWYIRNWLNVSGILDEEVKKELVEKYKNLYYEEIEETAKSCDVFPDVKESVSKLSEKGIVLGAHSNSSRTTVRSILKEHGLLKHFYHDNELCVVGGEDISKSPEAIEKVVSFMEVSKDKICMVGDSANDLRVAREAGISPDKTIAVDRGVYPVENLKAMDPKPKIVEDLNELLEVIL